MMRRRRFGYAAVLVVGLVVGGCVALRGMREVPAERVVVKPPADRAAIVFMRPATTTATTSLFELRGSQESFIGLLVQDTRMVYLTAPGRTRFMVIGRSANFLDAELEAGKTYHVAVLLGEAIDEHFRLQPLRPGAVQSRAVQDCEASCKWVENTEKSESWARRESSSIQRKKAYYLPIWERRPNRPTLVATDGR
jgi:hypothetical protein